MSDYVSARKNMVDGQLRTNDVTDHRILEAFLTIPKEEFLPASKKSIAYLDNDIEIKTATGDYPARYIMSAMPLARLIQAANIQKSDIVLDIGFGTGYSSAIISLLAGSVIGLEDDDALIEKANNVQANIDLMNIANVKGKLNQGYPNEGPYNIIILNGAVEEVPAQLFEQLKQNGRLLVIFGEGGAATARLYIKSDKNISHRTLFNHHAPALPGFQKQPSFVF